MSDNKYIISVWSTEITIQQEREKFKVQTLKKPNVWELNTLKLA